MEAPSFRTIESGSAHAIIGGFSMPTKDEEALALAQKHYLVEAGMTQIFRITGDAAAEVRPAEPIKLLEVNENTVPSGILPIQFGPSPASGLHYSSVILEVTPDEYRKIQSEELRLPHGWRVGDPIPRLPAENGS
jgi:hypothetical protein